MATAEKVRVRECWASLTPRVSRGPQERAGLIPSLAPVRWYLGCLRTTTTRCRCTAPESSEHRAVCEGCIRPGCRICNDSSAGWLPPAALTAVSSSWSKKAPRRYLRHTQLHKVSTNAEPQYLPLGTAVSCLDNLAVPTGRCGYCYDSVPTGSQCPNSRVTNRT